MAKFLSLDNLTRFAGTLKIGFSSTTAKTSLVDADSFLMLDSADTETVNGVSNVKKRKQITWANMKTEIGNFFAAADALVFKGTLGSGGTVTALPTTHQVGWTYRVITAGTYLGHVCEVGDLIIALVDRSGSGNVTEDWTVAQNNADLSGIPTASSATPAEDSGAGSAGVSSSYARGDHVHPDDSSKLDASHAGTGGSAHANVVAAGASGFMTGADKTKLDGIETGADVTDAGNVGSAIYGATAKTTPVDADTIGITDSAASNALKKVTWANIKAALNAVYAAATHTHPQSDITNLTTDLSNKLGTTGNASNTTVAFTVAGARTLPATGESLATLFGKVLKYFTDLGAAAYLAVGTAAGTVAAGDHTHSGYATSTHAHGNVTTDGKIGSTTDLPIITSTAGLLIAGAWASDAEIDAIVV